MIWFGCVWKGPQTRGLEEGLAQSRSGKRTAHSDGLVDGNRVKKGGVDFLESVQLLILFLAFEVCMEIGARV